MTQKRSQNGNPTKKIRSAVWSGSSAATARSTEIAERAAALSKTSGNEINRQIAYQFMNLINFYLQVYRSDLSSEKQHEDRNRGHGFLIIEL